MTGRRSHAGLSLCIFFGSQALDEDQPGDRVEHRKAFEEDRDFNQGELVHVCSGFPTNLLRTPCCIDFQDDAADL